MTTSQPRVTPEPAARPRAAGMSLCTWPAAAMLALGLVGCGGSGGGASNVPGVSGNSLRLATMEFGKLVDVYGLRQSAGGTTVDLYLADVMVGPDIEDERSSNSNKPDSEILYDFLSSDPDTLAPRLLITRVIGSAEFDAAFDALDDELRLVQPGSFGQNTATQPFSLVARDAALRLTFTQDLPLDESFFVERGSSGQVVGLKNTEAVQLLEIGGDPNQPGSLEQVATRYVPRGNQLILDPVLLGSEGLQYQTRNSASGMPASPDQIGANIRVAIALEGPLAIPGLRPDRAGNLNGNNLSGQQAVIRDFRSGNKNDNTPDIAQGFLRDAIPPRIAGQILMYVESVEPVDEFTQVVTIYKGGALHELDRGDAVRLMVDNSGVPAAVSEITIDPVDDFERPNVQHVRAVVRRVLAPQPGGGELDVFAAWDPSDPPAAGNLFWQQNQGIPAYPSNQQQREQWLVQYAPRLVLVAEYTAERLDSLSNAYGDDPRYFVNFTPAPQPFANGTPSEPNENVSPFAGAIVRFTKPVDMNTVKALDTFFFGTRDLLDPAEVTGFQVAQGIDPSAFIHAKFVTPHLVAAQVFDEDGSQTSIRLLPSKGFYLDDQMRQEDEGVPFEQKKFRYFLHLVGGPDGIKDLAGNELDFQSEVSVKSNVVIPFSLDTRSSTSGSPLFADNRVVTIARRFENPDEDEQPSYYVADEVPSGAGYNAKAHNLIDAFGAVVYLSDGTLSARPTTRVRQAVDDLNQQPAPPQEENSNNNFCPYSIGGEQQTVAGTATARFGSPLQNPLNPNGCRLQMVWREIDVSLSKSDPNDFNLDVEQIYWCPFITTAVSFDEFDRISLFLGHAEKRPEPCVGQFGALPTLQNSGIGTAFADNYVYNPDITGNNKEEAEQPWPAFVDQQLTILASQAITEVNGVYRYLPLPEFEEPYFVWRDERLMLQGANSGQGYDTQTGRANNYTPYVLSPFLGGQGRFASTRTTMVGQPPVPVVSPAFNSGFWDNRRNFQISSTRNAESQTGGLVGSIALPLMADFWVYPDDPLLPVEGPFLAAGTNGWQVSLALTSGPQPGFRSYSAGGLVQGSAVTVSPGSPDWINAKGGFTPGGARTRSVDNTLFWMMADYVKRVSVLTAGFVDIIDPHRMDPQRTQGWPPPDPRMGPYFDVAGPQGVLPAFDFYFEPPLSQLPGGTRLVPEFRGAGIVDPQPWAAQAAQNGYMPQPNETNFPLDPLKAGDAHIRKFDDRPDTGGQSRKWWTYYYNRHITEYVGDPNALMLDTFTTQFAAPSESFLPEDVRYFNWRFVFENNVAATPPITPTIDSFVVTYRFENR